MINEDDAKQKTCPLLGRTCVGSQCMAWSVAPIEKIVICSNCGAISKQSDYKNTNVCIAKNCNNRIGLEDVHPDPKFIPKGFCKMFDIDEIKL